MAGIMIIMMMIMMMMIRNAVTGRVELVTPPLDSGTVLPGVTRQSVLDLAADMEGIDVIQRRITLPEVRSPSSHPALMICNAKSSCSQVLTASREDRLMEVFGCGTAAIVSPVGGLKWVQKYYVCL